MNKKINLAGIWEFKLDGEKRGLDAHFEQSGCEGDVSREASNKVTAEASIFNDVISLPNTTAYAKKGDPNRNRETYFLTEVHKFEGYAWFRKEVELPLENLKEIENKHFFLTLERTRISYVWVDGVFAGVQDSFIAKHVYDLTGLITNSKPVITIMVSNVDYAAGGGHMTSPDTQTNWNGILGEISLEICDKVRISHATSFCDYENKKAIIDVTIDRFDDETIKEKIEVTADLCKLKDEFLELDSDCSIWEERATTKQADATDMEILESYLDIKVDALPPKTEEISLEEGSNEFELELLLPEDAKKWDEEEPYVYRIKIKCGESERTIWFGYRQFKAGVDHFEINGRKTFLRGRHQGMIFPLSGFAPMNATGWLKDFKIVKDWGINHERCHTCTPPEAAFLAADLLGFYFQPEIPFWGTWKGKDEEGYEEVEAAQDFLTVEGFNILGEYAGHPSFVMMSMGNELWGNADELNDLMGGYKAVRPDILFTQGSNNFQWVPNIQPNDDFFSGVRFTTNRQIRGSYAQCDAPLGRIQKSHPSTDWNYDEAIRPSVTKDGGVVSADGTIEIQYGTGVKRVKLSEVSGELVPEIPVVSHEIGQYFIYPDFDEITRYKGVCQARNLEVFQERLEDNSLTKRSKWYTRCSGALALACYKEELEAALRSHLMAGFQILDLQDFSGQGSALVGPLNALMENKGLMDANEWRRFCSDTVLLGEFPSYVIDNGSKLTVKIELSYFSKKTINASHLEVILIDRRTDKEVSSQRIETGKIDTQGLAQIGEVVFDIPESSLPESYEVAMLLIDDSDNSGKILAQNNYVFWAYNKASKNDIPKNVIVARNINKLMDAVDEGKSILYYIAPEDINENSLPGAYCTDFWNYPMFKSISESMNKTVPVGTLGTLIMRSHPALSEFMSESFSTPQWFDIIERSRVSNLNGIGFRPIVTVIDNCERNDNLGIIYEFEVMDGAKGPVHVLVCTSPLEKLIEEGNAPAAALEKSLLNYLDSGNYVCEVRTNATVLKRLAR